MGFQTDDIVEWLQTSRVLHQTILQDIVMEYYSIYLIIRISNKIRILAGIIRIIRTSTIH